MLKFTLFHLAVVTVSVCPFAFGADDSRTPAGYVRASDLIDADIQDAKDDEHAKIIDVLLAPTHDQVRYAIVRCEDHDDVDYLVPIETLNFATDDDGNLVLRAQRETLTRNSTLSREHSAKDETGPHADKRLAQDTKLARMKGRECRVSEVLGKDVTDAAGETLGSIEDFLISRTTGAIPFAILATGGVLGIGETAHVVPPTAIQSTVNDDGDRRLTLATTKELLANAPKCDEKTCPDPNSEGFVARLNELFASPASAHDAAIVHASTIVGADVRLANRDGDVGEVEDVTFDPVDGRLAFVVLDLDDLPDAEDCKVAVPWQAVRYDAQQGELTVSADAQRLVAEECRVKNGAADLNDPALCSRVTKWFGFESSPVTSASNTTTVCANDLLDRDVHDTTGKDVGEIEDVAVEPSSGQLRYVAVLLDRGNDKLVALKWNELSVPKEKNEVTLLVAPPQLRSDRSLRTNGRDGERRDG